MKFKYIIVKYFLLLGITIISIKAKAQSPSYISTETQNQLIVEKQNEGFSFTLGPINKNTDNSEFGGYKIGQRLYFCLAASESGFIKRIDEESKTPLYSLYFTSGTNTELATFRLAENKKRIHLGPLCETGVENEVYVTLDSEAKKGNSKIRNLKIYKATIDETGRLTDFVELPFNSDNFSTGHPTISSDGKTLYFSSDRPGGYGGTDLYKVNLGEGGTYGTPVNLGKEVNSDKDEMFPWMNDKGQLFYSSNGHVGFGGLDLFIAYETANGFVKRTNLGSSINSSTDDFAIVLSQDYKTGYFSSNRAGGKGLDDVYAFELQGSFDLFVKAEGLIVDNLKNKPLSGVSVQLLSEKNEVISSTVTDSEGNYSFSVDPESNYTVVATMENYFDKVQTISTKGVESGETLELQKLEIEKDPGLSLYGLLRDSKSNEPVSGCTVRIIDNMTGESLGSFVTDSNGDFLLPISNKHIGDRVSYNLEVSKDGYMKNVQTVNTSIEKEGKLDLTEKSNLKMVKIDKGLDLGRLVDLKPIYFDYSKYAIREDAAKELDKIVKIMNDNPTMIIELGSHTDSRGNANANLSLSEKRAKASSDYIKKRISNPSRISGKGYGESRLMNNCSDGVQCSEEQHAVNRRTEFVIK